MKIKRFLRWLLFVLWPFVIILFFVIAYTIGMNRAPASETQNFKNFFGAILQIFGSLIVVGHVFRNIRINKKNPFQTYLLIVKSCPCCKNSLNFEDVNLKISPMRFQGDPLLLVNPRSQKEKLAILQSQLTELNLSFNLFQKQTEKQLEIIQNNIESMQDENNKKIEEINISLIHSLLNSFPIQLLGVLFIVVGLLLPVV